MEFFHPLINRDYQKLNSIFSYISFSLGQKLEFNKIYDERGLNDELFNQIHDLLGQLRPTHYHINLHIEKPPEKKTGADILFRVRLNFPDVSFDRYILLQAKKYLIDDDNFRDTDLGNKHLTDQVAKMHSYNPEFSYLLLYSTTEGPGSNRVTYNPLYGESYWRMHPLLGEIFAPGKQFPILSLQGNYPITVLRAATWQAMHNVSPKSLLSHASCFPEFILNDLVTGKIGKTWDSDINSARGQFSFVVTLAIGIG